MVLVDDACASALADVALVLALADVIGALAFADVYGISTILFYDTRHALFLGLFIFFLSTRQGDYNSRTVGTHPRPVPESYGTFTILSHRFYGLYKVVPERFGRRFGGLCGIDLRSPLGT